MSTNFMIRFAQKKVYTVSDLEEKKQLAQQTSADWGSGQHDSSSSNRGGIHTIDNTFYDPVKIGKEALEHTNTFRKQNNLPPLKWHQSLCDIGAKHSKGKCL